MILTGILAYCIPDIPRSVRDHLNHQSYEVKEQKMRNLDETYRQKRRGSKSNGLSFREQTLNLGDATTN